MLISSYGMFYELTPQKQSEPVEVKVFSGDQCHEQKVTTIEKPGEWYFPPIASLITGEAHLLLAMLERFITDKGGHYLFVIPTPCALSLQGRAGGSHVLTSPASRLCHEGQVANIAKRFESLNCYDRNKVPGSILKIEKVNFAKGKLSTEADEGKVEVKCCGNILGAYRDTPRQNSWATTATHAIP